MGSRESDVSHGPVRARSRPLRGAASADTCPRRRAPIKELVARSAGNSTPPYATPSTSPVAVVALITYHSISVLSSSCRHYTITIITTAVISSSFVRYHSHIFTSGYLRIKPVIKMAYLSNSFDFEHLQNSTNWEAVHKKRSFVARKMHKINKTIKPILRALCRRNAVTPAAQQDGSALDPRGLSPEELENLQNEYIERKLSQAIVYDEDDYYSDTISVESGLGMSFEELSRPADRRQLESLLPEARYYMSRDFWFESDSRTAGRPSYTRQQTPQRQQPCRY